MKMIHTIARVLLGLIYFVFGGMGLLMVLKVIVPPMPPMTAGADAFFKGMMASGYLFPLIKITETVCGLLLLLNIATPLALVILAPVTLNIFLFHACLTPGVNNLVLPLGMAILQIVVMLGSWNVYRPLFSKAK